MMRHWFRLVGLAAAIAAIGAMAFGSDSAAVAAQSSKASSAPDIYHACYAPLPGFSSCGAIQLLNPAQNWHGVAHPAKRAPGLTTTSPIGGFYPGDLYSAYGLTQAGSPGTGAPTIAIVDAYDDPNAFSDLSTYRNQMNGAVNPNTGVSGVKVPPLCGSLDSTTGKKVTQSCVTFTKINQSGGTSYPRANKGWAQEISLDLDMASAVCPNCNIDLVEASSSSNSDLATAVTTAKNLANVAVVTNSYGGSESKGQTSYDTTYQNTPSTAITASSGDSGYGVEYPASAPNVTAVGGTSLTYDTKTGAWSRGVWSGAGAGCSQYEAQQPWQNPFSSNCGKRIVADIAAVADPNTGVAVYDTYGSVYGISGWMVFGGTSASAQIIGGIYGLAAFSGKEQPSPGGIYQNYKGNVTAVSSGSDGSCGDYLCDATKSTTDGYNGPTGLGVPLGIGAFTGSAYSASPSFSVSASPSSISMTQGTATSESYTVTVSSVGGYSGSVGLSASGCPGGSTNCTFSSSSVSLSSVSSVDVTLTVNNTNSLTPGSYPITITGKDTSGNTSSAQVTLDVTSSSSGSGGGVASLDVGTGTVTQNGHGPYHVPINVTAKDSSGNTVSGASVTLNIYSAPSTSTLGATCQVSGSSLASGTATTNTQGVASFQFTTKQTGTYCAVATSGTASGSSVFSVP